MDEYYKVTHVTKNGQELLNLFAKRNLFITNTKFKHKMTHRTSWVAQFKFYKTEVLDTVLKELSHLRMMSLPCLQPEDCGL